MFKFEFAFRRKNYLAIVLLAFTHFVCALAANQANGAPSLEDSIQDVLDATTDASLAAARADLIDAVKGYSPSSTAAKQLIDAIAKASDRQKVVLIAAFPHAACEEALNYLVTKTAKDKPIIRDAVLDALYQWPEREFTPLFNGVNLDGWAGDTNGYIAKDGKIVCKPGGNLYTEKDYADFIVRFEFKLPPGGNNGLGIRMPPNGHPAYDGMEIQILDDSADIYKNIKPYQHHGSVYGTVPAKPGYLKPVGEWNREQVIAHGPWITVILNGTVIVDADVHKASTPRTIDGRDHPGLRRTDGRIGFLGHGSVVEFRDILIKELK